MIRFNLPGLLRKLEAKEDRKITLKELSERSGCDRNVLSRIQSKPEIIPSSSIIDKLVQFFFFELSRDPEQPHLDRKKLRALINEFVWVYPDREEYWANMPASFRENPTIAISELWSIYQKFNPPERSQISEKRRNTENNLREKIIEAQKRGKDDQGEITLKLKDDELAILSNYLLQHLSSEDEDLVF